MGTKSIKTNDYNVTLFFFCELVWLTTESMRNEDASNWDSNRRIHQVHHNSDIQNSAVSSKLKQTNSDTSWKQWLSGMSSPGCIKSKDEMLLQLTLWCMNG